MQKSWMWQNQSTNGVSAVQLDLEEGTLLWLQDPGCACGDNSVEQTRTQFLNTGPFLSPPADVLREIESALEAIPTA